MRFLARHRFPVLCSALMCTALYGLPAQLDAAGITVYVGYADDLRANPNFPNPWNGSPNTIFEGGSSFDSGAVGVQNLSGAAITVNSLSVGGFTNGAVFNNGNVGWATNVVVPNGSFLIMTGYNNSGSFDTSDQLPGFTYYPDNGSGYTNLHRSTAIPQVTLTINSVAGTFADTGQILNTGGYDSASWPDTGTPNNESLQWRPIGTSDFTNPGGAPPGTPEPGTLTLAAIGLASFGAYSWRRRKALAR
jgi:hypothetical protein